jgi:hypothetical protein
VDDLFGQEQYWEFMGTSGEEFGTIRPLSDAGTW